MDRRLQENWYPGANPRRLHLRTLESGRAVCGDAALLGAHCAAPCWQRTSRRRAAHRAGVFGRAALIPWAEVASGGIKQHQLLDLRSSGWMYGRRSAIDQKRRGAALGRGARSSELDVYAAAGDTVPRWHGPTAEDVKFSIDSLFEPKAVAALLGPTRAAFKEVEIKDPSTVVIHLKQPAIFLPLEFSCAIGNEGMILPSKYFQQVGADGFAKAPIGSGPYKVVKNTIGSLTQIEALERHWAEGVPKFKTITFLLVPEESTRLAQLRTNEVDIIAGESGASPRSQSRRVQRLLESSTIRSWWSTCSSSGTSSHRR